MGRSLTSSPRLERKPFSPSRRGRQHLGASSSVRDTRPGLDQATPQRWCLVQMEQTLCGLHYSEDCRVPPRRHDGVHTMFSRVPFMGIQEGCYSCWKLTTGIWFRRALQGHGYPVFAFLYHTAIVTFNLTVGYWRSNWWYSNSSLYQGSGSQTTDQMVTGPHQLYYCMFRRRWHSYFALLVAPQLHVLEF